MAMQVCEGFVALIQQAMGGGPAPVGQAPEGEPVFKKGGKIAGGWLKNLSQIKFLCLIQIQKAVMVQELLDYA